MTWEIIVFGGAAILVAAGVQVVSGFGFALLAAPVLFTLLPPSTAVPALVGLSLTQVIGVLIHERGVPARIRGRVSVIAVAALPTLIIGALVLESLSRRVLLIAVGVIVFLTLLQRLRLRVPAAADRPLHGGRWSAAATGLVAGFLTTTVTVNGPPMVAYFGHVGANRDEFRRGLAALFLVLDVVALIVLVLVDAAATVDGALVALVLIPALVLGHVIGLRAAGRLDDTRWNRLVFILLAATGIAALVRAFV